jgi:hypothetical protein
LIKSVTMCKPSVQFQCILFCLVIYFEVPSYVYSLLKTVGYSVNIYYVDRQNILSDSVIP